MTDEAFSPRELLDFWLALSDDQVFKVDPAFDLKLKERFGGVLEKARRGGLDAWADTAEGALALVILLDQTSRNIHRGTPEMYEGDRKAVEIAKRAIARGDDQRLPLEQRRWFYMPFMHSEDLADQERCVELFRKAGIEEQIPYAEDHAEIIRRFGRFPHRNAILGRAPTEEELAYLAGGGFKG